MKRLFEELITERQFLKLYYDNNITHITQVNIASQLTDRDLQDVYQGLHVSDIITHFSYTATIDTKTKQQKNTIISNGLGSNKSITHLDLHEENMYQPNPQAGLAASVIPNMLATNNQIIYLDLSNKFYIRYIILIKLISK